MKIEKSMCLTKKITYLTKYRYTSIYINSFHPDV